MTKHFLSLFLLSLLSCSTAVTPKPSREKWKVFEITLTEGEALVLIHQKKNFLTLTFEQFFDPYYQTFKWSNACIEGNKIGEVREEEKVILWHSILYTGPDFRTGFCPEYIGSVQSSFVMLYCRQSKKLIQVNCSLEDCGNISWELQC
ncbi:MAG: hypothetical protein V4598_11880 [Bdellovibrionota bacterium]